MCKTDITKPTPDLGHAKAQKPKVFHLWPITWHVVMAGTGAFLAFPLHFFGSMIYGRPPIKVHTRQFVRYLKYAWTANPTDPPIQPMTRLFISLLSLELYFTSFIKSAAWLLDEILYGRQLDKINVKKPFFFISGARSGSTQLSRYLEEDPHLVAPNVMMDRQPYLWVWKIASRMNGTVTSKEKILERKKKLARSADFEKRHEMDDFRTGTFDPSFFRHHLNMLAMHMGDVVAVLEGPAEVPAHNTDLVEKEFVAFVDRMARKTLLFRGADDNDRFFIKGHFLSAAPALTRKYPDCSILTTIRDPAKRLRSAINSKRAMPGMPMFGPTPLTWLTRTFEYMETRYCEKEQDFFSKKEEGSNVKKCAVNFEDYVNDLPGTMNTIYKECFDMDHVPPEVPTKHEEKKGRGDYDINYSLEDLGVDVPAFEKRLAGYRQWMESLKRNPNKNE